MVSCKRWFRVTLFLCLSVFGFQPAQASAMGAKPHPPSSWIRVAVIQKAESVTLKIRGKYRIVATQTGELLSEGKQLDTTTLIPASSGLQLGQQSFKLFGIRVWADRTKAITVGGKNYRGLVEIFRESDMTLTVVNRVGIEEYIYGVLRHEVPPWWPRETLKTQAVIIRTYAAYQRSIREKEDYDVTGDVLSQVYGGAKGETRKIRRAANKTWGEVLHWEGEIFPSYYSSTCGGHTEAVHELWGARLSPLAGGPCEFCTVSKHMLWKSDIALDLIQKKLRWRKHDVGTIERVEVLDRTASGRVRHLNVVHDRGTLKLKAHDFRMMMGPNKVRSTLFDIKRKDASLYLEGRGWGHGVGLCQWGAYTQARRGAAYEDILAFYYPGTTLVQAEERP